MELAFTDREGIMALMEGLIATVFRDTLGVEVRDLPSHWNAVGVDV
jgi:aspartyl-tRNA synthetase